MTGRREIVAIAAGVAISLVVAIAWDPRIAVVVGGLVGPLAGLALPSASDRVSERGLIPANVVPLGQLTALTRVSAEELTEGPPPEPDLVPPPLPFGDLGGVSGRDDEERAP